MRRPGYFAGYSKEARRKAARAGICIKCRKANAKEGRSQCQDCFDYEQNRRQAIRLEVFAHYDGAVCKCCGETELEFLQIDHVGETGAEHRRKCASATTIYSWLRANGFPSGYEVLCANCNFAKGRYGECPHARLRRA